MESDVQLTINSQSQIALERRYPEEEKIPLSTMVGRRQVTVNNHINVFGDMPRDDLEKAENFNGQPENGYGWDKEAEEQEEEESPMSGSIMSPTYESQAMNIRLENPPPGSTAAVASKVCRNKNVDLAYTLVKATTTNTTHHPTNPPKGKPIEVLSRNIERQLGGEAKENGFEIPAVTKAVKPTKVVAPNDRPQIIVPVEIHPQVMAPPAPAPATAPITKSTPNPPERRLSNASSSNSVVDKTVVRHYVANDKSIYERRKYDEIEFEEFEIYDPSKEPPPPPPPEEEVPEKTATDGELYDSLDDKM